MCGRDPPHVWGLSECREMLVGAQMILWMLYPLKLLGQSCVGLKGRECCASHTSQTLPELSFPQVPGFYE